MEVYQKPDAQEKARGLRNTGVIQVMSSEFKDKTLIIKSLQKVSSFFKIIKQFLNQAAQEYIKP